MSEYYFALEDLTVGYQGHAVVEHIQVGLHRGQILTLIGPNGAGKSTILKTIVGQLPPISGQIRIDGKNAEEIPGGELSKKMAVVLTEKMKTELMTCEDVVATGRYPYTGRFGRLGERDYQVVEEAMELVHVTPIRDRDFMRISDGQRQRVMLARAICQEPELIILDEPTSFLDVKYKLEFLSVLQQLRVLKNLTVIMSIHELELAERVSDQILCVNGIQIDACGTPESVFRPGYITSLFGIEAGSFDEINTSMELKSPAGTSVLSHSIRSTDPQSENPAMLAMELVTGETGSVDKTIPAGDIHAADLFVIGGGGSARHIYRRLQRENRPFITGILYENDLDYPVANALAARVITAPPFEPVQDELLAAAKSAIDICSEVVCCKEQFGSYEQFNLELLQYAKEQDKKIDLLPGTYYTEEVFSE